MTHLTLENFTPTVNTRARTNIMRLLAYIRNEEPTREPQRRELKPFERLPIGVCSSPAVPCTIKAPISVITEDVKAGKWFPISTIAPPDLKAANDSYITHYLEMAKGGVN